MNRDTWRGDSGIVRVVALVFAVAMLVASPIRAEERSSTTRVRQFEFEYRVGIPASEWSAEPLDVFLPVALETSAQRVLDLEIETNLPGRIETDAATGNRFWHGVVQPNRKEPVSIRFVYLLERRTLRAGDVRGDRDSAKSFLDSNDRVVVGHPILEPILREIRLASPGDDPALRARAIYDWVVDNVEYKKVGVGWGNGDTFWACTERYGNCTDFHSLFISLARTEGIPARFEMGFPVPLDRSKGEISGYHCWVEFWLPDQGWVPIDASEAFKHPDRRELFYGTHPTDRVHFTTGRDLRLGQAHRGPALNYFIYPYVEVAGKPANIEIETLFEYRDRPESVTRAEHVDVEGPAASRAAEHPAKDAKDARDEASGGEASAASGV